MKTTPFIKFRLLRNILFWLLFSSIYFLSSSARSSYQIKTSIVLIIFNFLSFGVPAYVHNLWLAPKFLITRKYLIYSGLLALLIFLAYFNASFFQELMIEPNKIDESTGEGSLKPFENLIYIVIFILVFSMSHFSFERFEAERQLETLEKEKLKAENKNLKSQLNPHFLFNALNTIYGISRKKDIESANAVMLLSDMLRYMLYECNDNDIELEKEVTYIQNYINFATLRKRENSEIDFKIEGDIESKRIAPLILIPFIENCFKHGLEQQTENSWVNIKITVHENYLEMNCKNNYVKNQENNNSGGYGLENVKKRLELYYKERYKLETFVGVDEFEMNLKLDIW